MVSTPTLLKAAAAGLVAAALPTSYFLAAQERAEAPPALDVPYVPTQPPVVEKMLDMGEVGAEDYVIDLGSGDGRILVAAARRGARGMGVDLNPQRIKEAKANAEAAGVTKQIHFLQQDLFKTPIAEASVLTMYLLPSVNLQLRPRILEELKPGTRVVSHAFDMDEWQPDEEAEVDGAKVYLWIVPARVEGRWTLTDAAGRQLPVELRQRFQQVQGSVGQKAIITGEIEGEVLRFTADAGDGPRRFEGEVRGDRIEATAATGSGSAQSAAGWRLTRAS